MNITIRGRLLPMRRLAVAVLAVAVLVVGAAVTVLLLGGDGTGAPPGAGPAASDEAWAALDAQARCDSALALVTHPDRWPLRCRWRRPGETLHGQAFPPPPGPPPFDDPHVQIYVERTETRQALARDVAHELGHMHHTREPDFVPEWLAARRLPAATPSEVWTEDYAEVFAALFGPPGGGWRATTARPSPEALEELRGSFFA